MVRLKPDATYFAGLKALRHEFLSPAPRHGPPEGGHYVLMVRLKPDTTYLQG